MFKSIPEREAHVAKLADYFTGQPDGEYFSWLRVEHETALSMAVAGPGRQDARRALKRIKRPYEAVRAEGLRLSAPDNAVVIVKQRFARIDGAVRVADRTQGQLRDRHLDAMTPADQRTMLLTAGFFGAIRALCRENGTKILKA